jgi:hypothetical protein
MEAASHGRRGRSDRSSSKIGSWLSLLCLSLSGGSAMTSRRRHDHLALLGHAAGRPNTKPESLTGSLCFVFLFFSSFLPLRW